jgi:small subunit ribosomal protein S19e
MMEEIYEVGSQDFNEALKSYLKGSEKLVLPTDWDIIKTGRGRERAPEDNDWYYMRTAATVRQLAANGAVTAEFLANKYGNRKNRGVRPSKFVPCDLYLCESVLDNLKNMGWIDPSNKSDMLTDRAKKTVREIIEKVRE